MERKIPQKPVRPQQLSDEVADRFISGAPDEKPASPPPAPAQPDPVVPRALRKRKEPVTMTMDPAMLAEFDEVAASMGLSRSAGVGLAMRRMIDEEKAKKR